MASSNACPDAGVLRQFAQGRLASRPAAQALEHIRGCARCQESVRVFQNKEAQTGPNPAARGIVDATAAFAVGKEPEPTQFTVTQPSDYPFLLPPSAPGELGRMSHYRVLKLLGEGGMGIVFQAEDMNLERHVALKVMKPQLAATKPEQKERFKKEARASAALKNDNVVTIYHVGEENGLPFLAMEYLQGIPMDAWLVRVKKPTIQQILRLGKQTALGLAAAHEKGLVHRDIKPANLWIESTGGGRIKILDFGLAWSAEDNVHITRSGVIVGTPAYMSPEQARGEKLDPRADLFSLGCVLYRLVTGQIPFRGETTMAVLTSLAMDEPKPVREWNPEAPPQLAELIHKLLAKNPNNRPDSAKAVAKTLAAMEKELAGTGIQALGSGILARSPVGMPPPPPGPPPPPRRKKRRWLRWFGFGIAAILALGFLNSLLYPRGTLDVQMEDAKVELTIRMGEEVLADRSQLREFKLPVGKGQLDVFEPGADRLFTIDFNIVRNQRTPLNLNDELTRKRAAKRAPPPPPLALDWLSSVRKLAHPKKIFRIQEELRVRNPRFDGRLEFLRNGSFKDQHVLLRPSNGLEDLSPLQAMIQIKRLTLQPEGPAPRLEPNLDTLAGLELESLSITAHPLTDLSPLKRLPKLKELDVSHTNVRDLSSLADLRLSVLAMWGLKGVALTPLVDLPLTELSGDFGPDDAAVLRKIKTLRKINTMPKDEFLKGLERKDTGKGVTTPLDRLSGAIPDDLKALAGGGNASNAPPELVAAWRVPSLSPGKIIPKVNKVLFTRDGATMITSGVSTPALRWDLRAGGKYAPLSEGKEAVNTWLSITEKKLFVAFRKEIQITSYPDAEETLTLQSEALREPMWQVSPDGRWIAHGEPSGVMLVFRLDKEKRQIPFFVPATLRSLAFHPTRSLLLAQHWQLDQEVFLQFFDLEVGKNWEGPRKPEFKLDGAPGPTMPTISPDGDFVYFSAEGSPHIYRFKIVGGEVLLPLGPFGAAPRFSISPDGRMLAVTSEDERLQIVNALDGGVSRQVSLPYLRGKHAAYPFFAPDNRHVAIAYQDVVYLYRLN